MARDIRNLASHAKDKKSPTKTDLDDMCKMLMGEEKKEGILERVTVGKRIYEQLS